MMLPATESTTLGVAAKGIMNSPVITVDPKKNLRDCEAMMHKHDISLPLRG